MPAGVDIMKDANYWINKLNLKEHPEGGYYNETYRSDESIEKTALPARFDCTRSFSTAIYFLLKGDKFSAFHRFKSDELWHFYTGSSITLHIIDHNGKYNQIILGSDYENGETFQAVIKAGFWFGATVNDRLSYALVGCTVSPGFNFNDFEIGNSKTLIKKYPSNRSIIEKLTLK